MTLAEILDEYVVDQGGDEWLRAWLRSLLAKKPELLDDLLIERMKKEIQQDAKSKKTAPPPQIKEGKK